MGTWTTRAKLGMVNVKEATVAEFSKHDAMLAYVGKGSEYNTYFAENVQVAADGNIPCMAFMAIDPNAYAGINPGAYPKPDNDPHIKTLDRALYSGGVYGNPMRAVKGIMIDAEYYRTSDGNYLTATWTAANAAHILDIVYKRYKLPVWLYFNKALYTYYANIDDSSRFAIEKLVDTYGICYPDSGVVIADGYPVDGESPYTNIPFSGKYGWQFWGIGFVDNLYTFIFNGDKAALYKELNFTPAETTPTEPEPEEPETPVETPVDNPTVDLTAVLEQLAIANAKLDAIKAVTDGIAKL